jgi:hypothetical protein
MGCFRNISVNTLYKDDYDDDDITTAATTTNNNNKLVSALFVCWHNNHKANYKDSTKI